MLVQIFFLSSFFVHILCQIVLDQLKLNSVFDCGNSIERKYRQLHFDFLPINRKKTRQVKSDPSLAQNRIKALFQVGIIYVLISLPRTYRKCVQEIIFLKFFSLKKLKAAILRFWDFSSLENDVKKKTSHREIRYKARGGL